MMSIVITTKNNITFLLCLLFFTTASASELSESAVKKIILNVEKSSEKKNIEGIAEALSDNFEMKSYVSFRGEKHFSKKSKQEYLQILKAVWTIYTHYESTVSNTVIKIKNNKAYVTSDVKESATHQGRTMIAHSKQEAIIEMINNTPLITSIASNVIVKD